MALTKAKLLALTNIALIPVSYKDTTTGEPAFVKRFTVAEHAQYQIKVMNAKDDTSNALAYSLTACDENGNLLFSSDDVKIIQKLPETVVNDALKAFNKRFAEVEPTAKNVEEAEKN